jgi:hypothetical protein
MNVRLVVVLCSLLGASHVIGGEALERLLGTQPTKEAEGAFARGDRRYIVIPICESARGEVIPGWPINDSPEIRKAIEEGRRPVTCADIGPDPQSRQFKRLAKYAEQYNQRLLQLSSGRSNQHGL